MSTFRIEFKPFGYEVWSFVLVSTVDKLHHDCARMDIKATVLEVGGEHGDPDFIGTVFDYVIGTGPGGDLDGKSAVQRMMYTFKDKVLPSNRFDVQLGETERSQN